MVLFQQYVVSGSGGSMGDGGPATAALLNQPEGICAGPVPAIIYIADKGNSRVRKVNLVTGIIITVAGPVYQAMQVIMGRQPMLN